jgi:hypothetical protein
MISRALIPIAMVGRTLCSMLQMKATNVSRVGSWLVKITHFSPGCPSAPLGTSGVGGAQWNPPRPAGNREDAAERETPLGILPEGPLVPLRTHRSSDTLCALTIRTTLSLLLALFLPLPLAPRTSSPGSLPPRHPALFQHPTSVTGLSVDGSHALRSAPLCITACQRGGLLLKRVGHCQ